MTVVIDAANGNDDLEPAVDALRQGRLVAFPTETVYGLGADASNGDAVRGIFAAKGRPSGHPLIVHVASVDQVPSWVEIDDEQQHRVELLAKAFWPGPLTIVVPRSDRVASETVGGRPTVGLRVPDHPVALALLTRFGGGVAAPSANLFGRVSPTTAAHVLHDLDGVVDVVVDGGATEVGIESTIVELVGVRATLLRPGAVTLADLERVLAEPVADGTGGEARAPGMLQSHYAPDATVELVATADLDARLAAAAGRGGAGTPGLGVIAPVVANHQPSWLLPADAEGYAARLYGALREADRLGLERVLVVAPTSGEMIAAVLDRLTKAAAPRP